MVHIEIGKFIIFGLRWHDILFVFARALTFLTPSKISQFRIFLLKAISLYRTGIKKLIRLKAYFYKLVFLNHNLYKMKAVKKPKIVSKPIRYPPSS